MSDERHPQPVNYPVQKTIAAKLRKLFTNKSQSIAPAIPEEMPGGGGGSGGALFVKVAQDPQNNSKYVCNKTCKEILDAFLDGKSVIFDESEINNEYVTLAYVGVTTDHFQFMLNTTADMNLFTGNEEDDYPIFSFE